MALPLGNGLLPSLVLLTLIWSLGHGFIIDVYRNGDRVKNYEDKDADVENRAESLPPSSALRGQMYYAVPYRNACEPLNTIITNETMYNWVALIDNYFDCPENAAWNLYRAGYGMMLAYSSTQDVELYSTPPLPRVIVTSSTFVNFLRNFTIVGVSPNASEYYIKVQSSNWLAYEKLFMIFGGVLLAAVAVSVIIFCASIFCRTVLNRWRTRGLSRWRVRQLPKRKYRKDKEECDSCSICLEEFKTGENLRVLPCDHIFHPSCVDEWLQKWNRTCPLCKSTIQRLRRGGGISLPPTSSSTDQERSHLLSHEESEESQEEIVERRDPENYGAVGHTDNPLSTAGSLQLEGGGEGREEEEGEGRQVCERNVNITLEVADPIMQLHVSEESSNLAQSDDNNVAGTTTHCKYPVTSPLEEQV